MTTTTTTASTTTTTTTTILLLRLDYDYNYDYLTRVNPGRRRRRDWRGGILLLLQRRVHPYMCSAATKQTPYVKSLCSDT